MLAYDQDASSGYMKPVYKNHHIKSAFRTNFHFSLTKKHSFMPLNGFDGSTVRFINKKIPTNFDQGISAEHIILIS